MRTKSSTSNMCAALMLGFAFWFAASEPASATLNGNPDVKVFERLEWRSIGPANMGGRVADVEGVPGNPNIVYVATASGGLWKTTNGGVTWTPLFEREGTLSIGDIALDPRNPDVIWLGAGESNTRNSVSFGDGVYKSTDGGKTWQHLGLRETEHISRIVVNPLDTDTVYVGAIGHASGPNDERGVFMTTDGGRTWQKTLYIDDQHGISDLDIDPQNPNILYAGVWRFERKPWTFVSGSEKGGVFKSIDGGRTWKKITGGLPKLIGRIGVKVAPSNPDVVYAITEAKEGTMYRSDDRGETFRMVSRQASIVSRGFYYSDLRVDPANENRIYAVASTLFVSIDGGRTYRAIAPRIHIDYHALWIDPLNPKRLWAGQDGGVALSQDQGESWEYVNNIPLGQFYHVYADNRQPFYYLMGGLQDNGSWTGPSRTREPAGILNDDWRMVSFGDGFKVINHADDPELYLSLSQGGNIVRTDMRNREQQLVRPFVGGGGGPAGEQKYRFNWNAPLIPSPHDKNTVYLGGNVVFKSTDFGKSWTRISEDLTTNDPEKLKEAGGPIATENTTAEYHCTLISLAESPLRSGVIWAGSDDGNIQMTVDGKNWTNLTKNIAGLPANSPVSHVEPSAKDASLVYASFDRHQLDDYKPYIFRSTDNGKTWTDVSGNLPAKAYVHVVREDPRNPNLIYAGTEIGLYASYTGGTNWIELNLKNLPRVAIHDIVVHPRENDLILGTHGRSLLVFDDATPIQQMTPELAAREAHLFPVRPALRFTTRFTRYGIGDKVFTGPNPPSGAIVYYHLKEKPDPKIQVKMQVLDGNGRLVREVARIPREAGVNLAVWDLSTEGPEPRRRPGTQAQDEGEGRGGGGGGGGFGGGGGRGPQALPGTYTVKLTVGDKSFEQKVEVRIDPTVNASPADIQARYDLALKLKDMISAVNLGLRALDGVREQLQAIDRTVKGQMPDAPRELTAAVADNLKRVDALIEGLAPGQAEGLGYRGRSQLLQKLGGLFGNIEGANAAPTPAMREAFAELQPEFRTKLEEINRYLVSGVAGLNETLRKNNAPTVIAGKAVELPR